MRIVGITGTNGKTTCVHLICSLLKDHLNCASFGTLGIKHFMHNQCITKKTSLTTLGKDDLQKNLQQVLYLGCEFIAMEVSSHGLVQNRVEGIEFTDVVLTNLSHDHLDYHKDMEDYFQAKVKLFTQYCSKLQRAIINLDDHYGIRLIKLLQDHFNAGTLPVFNITGYSVRPLKEQAIHSDIDLTKIKILTCEQIAFTATGINAKLNTPWGKGDLQLNLLGQHNLSNMLVAIAICGTELSWLEILNKSIHLKPAEGRLQSVFIDSQITKVNAKNQKILENISEVIIDYAHTPDALANALLAMKQHFHAKKICCVFGCGGDRDRSKRPEMLKVAEKYCEVIILTQDNSRNEDPNQIMQDLLSHNITNKKLQLLVEMDRKAAINLAINNYHTDHVILIAGKGHETKQIIAEKEYFFSDHMVVQEALNGLFIAG